MTTVELHDRPPAVTVRAGDCIAVHLAENPSTGYRWSATITGDAVEVDSSEFYGGAPGLPGASGRRVIVLRAQREGHAEVAFVLARSWQPDAPVDAWQLGIRVTD